MPSQFEKAFHDFNQWVSRLRRSSGYENVSANEGLMESKPIYHHATYGSASASGSTLFKHSGKVSGRYDDCVSDDNSGDLLAKYHALVGIYGAEGSVKNTLIGKQSPSTQGRLSTAFETVKSRCVIS